MIGRIIKNLLLITVPAVLLCFVFLEVVLRTIIPAAEIPYKTSGNELVLRYDPQKARSGRFTAGALAQQRAHWRINDHGWNSDIDCLEGTRERPLIAVIGDSFVEAFQVDPDENLAAILRRRVAPAYDVYSFGMQGSPLSQYLHVSRYVAHRFSPDVLVFVVVHNDFDEMLRDLFYRPAYLQLVEDNGTLVETPVLPYRSRDVNQWIRKSALARYLWLNVNIGALVETTGRRELNANIDVNQAVSNRDAIEDAVQLVVQRIQDEHPSTPIVYLMDAPRVDLYAGRLAQSNVLWLNQLMERTCRKVGCYFLDLSGPFADHFRRDSTRFESPYDAHWNEYGHRVAGEALHEWMLDQGILAREPTRE